MRGHPQGHALRKLRPACFRRRIDPSLEIRQQIPATRSTRSSTASSGSRIASRVWHRATSPRFLAPDGEDPDLIGQGQDAVSRAGLRQVQLRKAPSQSEVSGHHILLPAGQYHESDFELRTVAPIDLQVVGRDATGYNCQIASGSHRHDRAHSRLPSTMHTCIKWSINDIRMNVDRIKKPDQLGLTERDVSGNMLDPR